jgi:DNA polymerase I-like protein with 3'-5' exonuclease and polymerase domains
MLDYCILDTEVNWRVMEALDSELVGYGQQAIDLEHDVAQIMINQERKGWLLDVKGCLDLLNEMKGRKDDVTETVQQVFGPLPVLEKEVAVRRKKDGSVSTVGLGGVEPSVVGGDFSRICYPDFNLGSRRQVGERLVRAGWEPKDFTPTGQPRVDEATLDGVDIPEAALIRDYFMLEKRIAMIESWLELADDEGRVHGRVNSNGAVTGRMTHNNPNVAQVTARGKTYGTQMRECWTVPDGYSLVGCDADALELRMLAHYMDDPDFINAVLTGDKELGTDVHSMNQKAAGLETRDQAKTFIYAFLYGAGDEKIGSIVGGGRSEGRALKARFLAGMPNLAKLKSRVERAAQRGWLKGLDGRRILVRSQHAALNTLLQGAGACVMKEALVHLDRAIVHAGVDAAVVGNIHDEWQIEAKNEHAETVGKLAERALVKAGETLGLRLPIGGTAVIGRNWSETH